LISDACLDTVFSIPFAIRSPKAVPPVMVLSNFSKRIEQVGQK
jgi:hypothetical protein